MENPRKVAFKKFIVETLGSADAGVVVTKADLLLAVQEALPNLCDNSEPCYPGCYTRPRHPKWKHEFDRSLYDLTKTIPPKVIRPERIGVYVLA